jgi:hypothetical protein
MKITDKYVFFYKEIFSQWYPCQFKDLDTLTTYNCAEQFMMHKKALYFNDLEIAEKIMATDNPREQKALGRLVKNYDDALWNKVKYKIVYNGNFLKFMQNQELLVGLLNTGNKLLVEASLKDKIWGIGMYEDTPGVEDSKNWKGENLLGKALTEVRNSFMYAITRNHYEHLYHINGLITGLKF